MLLLIRDEFAATLRWSLMNILIGWDAWRKFEYKLVAFPIFIIIFLFKKYIYFLIK